MGFSHYFVISLEVFLTTFGAIDHWSIFYIMMKVEFLFSFPILHFEILFLWVR